MDTFDKIMIVGLLVFIAFSNFINNIALVNIEKNIEVLVNALVK